MRAVRVPLRPSAWVLRASVEVPGQVRVRGAEAPGEASSSGREVGKPWGEGADQRADGVPG